MRTNTSPVTVVIETALVPLAFRHRCATSSSLALLMLNPAADDTPTNSSSKNRDVGTSARLTLALRRIIGKVAGNAWIIVIDVASDLEFKSGFLYILGREFLFRNSIDGDERHVCSFSYSSLSCFG